MFLSLRCPPSLHNRTPELRAVFMQDLALQLAGRCLAKKVYRVDVVFQGNYFDGAEPTERDADNLYKNLSDCLARCLGWKSDKYFQRDFHVRCEQATTERVNVTLT
jgi:Holliday junction resolvase RusA-like endonuclease